MSGAGGAGGLGDTVARTETPAGGEAAAAGSWPPLPADAPPLERVRLTGEGGVRLSVVRAGPRGGRPVVLLHGFPESWWGWRHQLGPLAAAGLRLWIPDQRGYGLSDRPGRVADYRLDALAADAAAVVRAARAEALEARAEGADGGRATGEGRPPAVGVDVVGHDWGGGVAWWLAISRPELVRRLVVLNCPHPAVMRRAVLTDPRQALRSWYMAFFQLPWLPERILGARDGALLRRGLAGSGRRPDEPGGPTFTSAELRAYAAGWREPGTLRAMIDWYRALRLRAPAPPADNPQGRVRVPTLLVWGGRDRALGRSLARPTLARCEAGRLVELPEATHWLIHEEPARIAELIVTHLGTSKP